MYLRPLIEQGLLVPITPPQYCLHCLTTHSFGPDADKRFERIFRDLTRRYNEQIDVSFKYEDGLYLLEVRGPDSLIEHGAAIFFSDKPNPVLKNMPRIMKWVSEGKEVVLSRSTIKKMHFDRRLASEIRSNIIFELAISLSLGTTLLTDQPLDIELLRHLSPDPVIEQRNQLLQKYMTCVSLSLIP